MAAIIAHSLVIQAGINMAYSAVLLPQLFAEDTDIKITMSESTWIASIVTLALPPGALAVGPLMDKFGRKKVCMLTSLPFMCSWILQSRSTEVWHMYLARILAGIAAGAFFILFNLFDLVIFFSKVCRQFPLYTSARLPILTSDRCC